MINKHQDPPKTCPVGHPPKILCQLMFWPRKKFRVLKSKRCTSKHLACFSSLDSVMASAMIAIYLMEKLIDKPTSMTAKFLHKNKLYHLMMICCAEQTLEI